MSRSIYEAEANSLAFRLNTITKERDELQRDLAQARAELEGVKKQRDEAERRAGIWMSLVHGLPN